MKKIIAFAGSNSRTSINAMLLNYVVQKVTYHKVKTIHLTDYTVPMYSADIEQDTGMPIQSQVLKNIIAEHDALIIAVNEHNSAPSVFFKNHLDWLSRIDNQFLLGKKVLLMSTSPGKRGAKTSLEFTRDILLPRFGAEIVESFSLPSFDENFDTESNQLTNEVYSLGLNDVITNFEQNLIE